MTTIFSKIINREIEAQFIYEDKLCVAVMDKFPAINGQVLIIPKKEVDYAFDLEDETYLHIFMVAKKITKALDKVFDTTRTCLVVEGFEVPHVHIKLYPMTKTDTNLADAIDKPKEQTNELLQMQANQIKTAL
jgi:histidine triad (HIT) family protein